MLPLVIPGGGQGTGGGSAEENTSVGGVQGWAGELLTTLSLPYVLRLLVSLPEARSGEL